MSILNRLFGKRNDRSITTSIVNDDLFQTLCTSGYTKLDDNPEVQMACRKIANLISTMTIHLMSNTENGDQRLVNELSKKIDITPNRYMTRRTWMDFIVMNLLLYGRGNSVVIPHTEAGYLGDLEPVRSNRIVFHENGIGYTLTIDGKTVEPDNVLHFVLNPDDQRPWMGKGMTTTLKGVADNLKQAAATEKGFLSHEYKPSVIINVDGMGELDSEEGRDRILQEYIRNSEAGKPWVIPSELMTVTQVKPMTLADLAIKDTIEIDKRTVAAILGVPAFVVGVGKFDEGEWNNFVNSTILPIAKELEQEMSRKLLINPKWYFKFNIQSLYSYDIQKIANVYKDLRAIGVVTGNEVRDRIGMSPKKGLDELVMLENYIPTDKLGDQKKLKDGGES